MKKAPDDMKWVFIIFLAAVEVAVMACLGSPQTAGVAAGMTMGMTIVLMVIGIPPLSKDATKHPVWRKEDRFPRATGSRGGATLVTAVVAMMLIVMCMTAVMQAYMQGGRAREVQARRVAATAACREVIEGARAHGYGALQAVGEYEFPVQARQPMNGVLQIVAGPVPGSKLVTATVTWAGDDRAPAGSATLSTIMSARGIGG